MKDDPLVIFGSPRGGTSLVAGLFVAHGWWTGETYPGTQGYVNHENAKLKEFLKKNFKMNAGVPEPDPGKANLWAFSAGVVPIKDAWLFKGPSEYYPIFRHWFPEMQAVFAFRDLDQAVRGAVRRGGKRQVAEPIIRNRYEYLEEKLKDRLTWRVDVDKVVKGDLAQVAPIIEWCGVEFDYDKAMNTIDPSIFHT